MQSAAMSGAMNTVGAVAGTVSVASGAVALTESAEPPKPDEDVGEDTDGEDQETTSSFSFGSLDDLSNGGGNSKMKVKSSVVDLN